MSDVRLQTMNQRLAGHEPPKDAIRNEGERCKDTFHKFSSECHYVLAKDDADLSREDVS